MTILLLNMTKSRTVFHESIEHDQLLR